MGVGMLGDGGNCADRDAPLCMGESYFFKNVFVNRICSKIS
jgi:hypothetical protein